MQGEYDPSKQYTNIKRVTIGKVLPEDENKMRPNENFRKYFPEVEQAEEKNSFMQEQLFEDRSIYDHR